MDAKKTSLFTLDDLGMITVYGLLSEAMRD